MTSGKNNISKINSLILKVFCILAFCLVFCSGCQKGQEFKESSFFAMGTLVNVTLPKAYQNELKNLHKLIKSLSDEVTNLTAKINTGETTPLTPFVCNLLKEESRYRSLSSGRFNAGVFTLLELYGFPEGPFKNISHEEKSLALENIKKGYNLFEEGGICYAKSLGAKIDLGATAKGAIVDKGAEYLKERGITDFIINAGGDLYASGTKNGKKWRIGVKNPFNKQGVSKVYELSDVALATSGTYERFFTTDTGEKISHLVNALTGVQGDRYVSLTVIAKNADAADAFATVYFFMNEDEIKSRCIQDGTKVFAIDANGSSNTICQ